MSFTYLTKKSLLNLFVLNLTVNTLNIGKLHNIIAPLNRFVIRNHLFASIFAYVQLQRLTTIEAIKICYQVRRDLFSNVVRSFISELVLTTNNLNLYFTPVVNA